ncbi:right-handed parallel beta-helix repeat-containing protein [Gorillibacterium sp. sgz5001074]|uniref:right-handed parallel beta-helix repeat-containing protein n=1 Tax=Gorillibacterium sp. sgz5001074 TaxID=3446695 RepID=UPI003F668397
MFTYGWKWKTEAARRPAALLLGLVLLGAAGTISPGSAAASGETGSAAQAGLLQPLLDGAPAGSSLVIPAGTYQGPAVLKKPLRITTVGSVELLDGGTGPVFSIETDGASVSGLQVTDRRDDPDTVAVQVTGSDNELSGLSIRSMGYGIRMKGAHRNRVTDISVEGLTASSGGRSQETEPSERGNGIDLLESNGNKMTGNRITNMFDGIYVEKGDGNRMEGNTVTHSRYGYHLMFSTHSVIEGNTGSRNVTGAMIMSDAGSRVTGNDFAKQSENATAQGILLFDVKEATVENNRVEGNRLGLYAQGITGTTIRHNRFLRNFVGIQMMGAEGIRIEGNEFVANVVQAQAQAGKNNRIALNYWDDHAGLDLQGDGVSDLAYRSQPFFLALTEEKPAYQIFFGSPGLGLLEQLFGAGEEPFTDAAPWMEPELEQDRRETGGTAAGGAGAAGAVMLAVGAGLFYIGGRRR